MEEKNSFELGDDMLEKVSGGVNTDDYDLTVMYGMYGAYGCPKCGGVSFHRTVSREGVLVCNSCGCETTVSQTNITVSKREK